MGEGSGRGSKEKALEPACCLECHFDFEERELFPKLPIVVQRWLLREHAALLAAGKPRAGLIAHAEREMRWFRLFCTELELEQCDVDHAALV